MTWQAALACVFLAGIAMLVLSATFLVQRSMSLVPGDIKLATIIGIGLLLATIGFESAGIIRDGQLADLADPAAWTMWVSLAGLVLIAAMFHYNLPGAILIGVVAAAVTTWAGKGDWPTRSGE
jgi:AGZA family xanthine/uracil permease-like MFS transporter